MKNNIDYEFFRAGYFFDMDSEISKKNEYEYYQHIFDKALLTHIDISELSIFKEYYFSYIQKRELCKKLGITKYKLDQTLNKVVDVICEIYNIKRLDFKYLMRNSRKKFTQKN